MDTVGDRAATLILRAWVEPTAAPGLRVRIIPLTDAGPDNPLVVSTVDEACAAVRGWLDGLTRTVG
ncbi:hypothetical protein V5P93_003496 [Actinokineospora auranticolor]|uniref:Uncharacterized protein n=1 Tax=Actinokineospora auranticolor TaxID=155976 RepID=A0A2S6GPL3_9PSEU|nr:hypothetical protein [Actinokineospora auranticolor]PPK67159.1 hypothetical protein CLV40_108156 [Actinokineospora auranticolor]